MTEATPVDSGFTPQNIADAEWLVANMPGIRRFHDMATYEKAMICHTAARFRATALADMQRRVVDLEGALVWIRDYAIKLRKGTDDWFDLVEIEAIARQSLSDKTQEKDGKASQA